MESFILLLSKKESVNPLPESGVNLVLKQNNGCAFKSELSIIRVVSLRLRGSREKVRSLPFEDGAPFPYVYISKYFTSDIFIL